MTRKLLIALVVGGALAGLADIAMAAIINHVGLDVIMRAIARGLLGGPAMQGGLPVAILGLFLQVAMSVLIALIYGAASLRLPVLTRRWVTSGLAYGVVVFVVMNWVVVPLSAIHALPRFKSLLHAGENLLAMFVFALIIAFFAHRGASRDAEPA
jgi:hypothetical protein